MIGTAIAPGQRGLGEQATDEMVAQVVTIFLKMDTRRRKL
jgi:hypothetical protein